MSDDNSKARRAEVLKEHLGRAKQADGDKGITREAKDALAEEWRELARLTVCDDETIALFRSAFRVIGAEPFYDYVCETSDPRAYDRLLTACGSASAQRLEIFLSLFSLELRSPSSPESVAAITAKLPEMVATGSHGKPDALRRTVSYSLTKPLAKGSISEECPGNSNQALYTALKGPLERIASDGKVTTQERAAAIDLLEWLYPNAGSNPIHLLELKTGIVVDRLAGIQQASSGTQAKGQAKAIKAPSLSLEASTLREVSEGLRAAALRSLEQEQELNRLRRENDGLTQRLSEAKAQADEKGALAHRLEGELASANAVVASLTSERDTLKEELDGTELMLATTEERTADREQADRQSMIDELQFEYRDFSDALDMPMTLELGEVLRAQLSDVFGILISHGYEL